MNFGIAFSVMTFIIPPLGKGDSGGFLLAISGVSADLNEVSYNNSSPPKKDLAHLK